MCEMSRRELLTGGTILSLAAEAELLSGPAKTAEIGKVDPVAPDVYFHEGDLQGKGHCNNGWVIFEDYVLVIDANFPSGAQEIIPKIRALTDKPIRFAFDTHHHGDHAYGNQVWVENGAVPVAHTGVAEEMKKYEPARWNDTAKGREDVRASKLKPPSVLFPRELIFDDGKHRVELIHFGVAHTNGDAFAWLPKERILFSGDACVNGPYNYVGDGNVEKWVATLEAVKKLDVRALCPGHGPRGTGTILQDQQQYFKVLREEVGALVKAKKRPEEIRASIAQIRSRVEGNAQVVRYVGKDFFAAQVEKVYTEMTGKALTPAQSSLERARYQHAHAHGLTVEGSLRA
jgi:cyclase